MSEWHKADISEVVLEFGTDVKVGRTNLDNNRRRNGTNRIFNVPAVDSARIVRRIASDASLILLAITYVIAAVLGFHAEAFVALPVLLLAFILSYRISFRSEKRISDSYKLLLPKAKVIENGKRIRLSTVDVEVGDLIYFAKGDVIPADARLVSSEDLFLSERFYNEYSGKSEYKHFKKDHDIVYADDISRISYDNMVYATSLVRAGKGSAIVTAVGNETRIARTHLGLSLVPENDKPDYLKSFNKFTKRFSLFVLFSLIPLALVQLYLNSINGGTGEQQSFLYVFLTMLAVAVTSMSELVASPAEAIVSYTIFNSNHRNSSQITKLSSVESLASTDTVLILCPDVLKDKRRLVRRVFFSEKEYRFDSLRSDELNLFSATLSSFYNYTRAVTDPLESKAIKRFLFSRAGNSSDERKTKIPRILRNFPSEGAISCVYLTSNNYPVDYISKSNDLAILDGCDSFRTDGGSKWQLSDDSREKIARCYNTYIDLGLKVYLFISKNEHEESAVFEGMVVIGEEFPFSDGEVFSDFAARNIKPILVLENETPESVKFALNCGIATSVTDIVFASELSADGRSLLDVPLNAPVYIGFDRNAKRDLVHNLLNRKRKVLPIIKDSADREAIAPLNVYATHAESSYDSIKIASSLSLIPAVSDYRTGGIKDALGCINNSALSQLKLDYFNRYLTFANLMRLATFIFSLISGNTLRFMTAFMVIVSGLLCDLLALSVVTTVKATPIRPSVVKSKSSISGVTIFCGFAGVIVSLCIFVMNGFLINVGAITQSNVRIFTLYSSVAAQFFALFGLLTSMIGRSTKFKFNTVCFVSSIALIAYMLLQNWLPTELFTRFAFLSFARVDLHLLPWILIPCGLSFVAVVAIDKLFSSSIFTKK